MLFKFPRLLAKISFDSSIYFFGVISLSFLFFEVVFVHAGFFLNQKVAPFTLPFYFFIYTVSMYLLFYLQRKKEGIQNRLLGLVFFILFAYTMFAIGSSFFSHTYDTSWDGQGYHSSGIVSFATGWNPIYEKNLPIHLPDADILVQGYPKALWLMQSTLYTAMGSLDGAKVLNLALLIIATTLLYSFFRRLKIHPFLSLCIALLMSIQSHVVIQFFSFMEDGIMYEILLCAIALLGICMTELTYASIIGAFASIVLLMGVKYTALPLAGILGILFLGLCIYKLYRNKLTLDENATAFFSLLLISGILFLWVPYFTNLTFFHYVFYPTNFSEIRGMPLHDNFPKNIDSNNKLELVFYGIFSKSQTDASSNSTSPQNVAQLKIPFTFSKNEILDSTETYNNRVGAGGPLFSGILILSIVTELLLFLLVIKKERKYIYVSLGLFLTVILTVFISPTPNLLRYSTQVLLIPFIAVLSAILLGKKVKAFYALVTLILLSLSINAILFSFPVFSERNQTMQDITEQLDIMQHSNLVYDVDARRFYSNYIRLAEHKIPFRVVSSLQCKTQQVLLYTSYTTTFCAEERNITN